MQSNITRNIVVTLVMSAEEADWLHTIMQNPFYCLGPEDEDHRDKEMRLKFWNATSLKDPAL
jgi:hypothetical protein